MKRVPHALPIVIFTPMPDMRVIADPRSLCGGQVGAYGLCPTMGAVALFQGSMIFSSMRQWPSTLTQVST